MQLSVRRLRFLTWDVEVRDRIVLLAVGHCQDLMNLSADDTDTAKLKAKASELLNNPESYKERLALSVVSLLAEDQLHDGVDDMELLGAIIDSFDALAGVTRPLHVG